MRVGVDRRLSRGVGPHCSPLPPGEGWGEGTGRLIRTLRLLQGRSRGVVPAADSLSFASPKESKQRKGDPTARVPALRSGQPAVLGAPACRRTRCVHFVHAAQTAAASQMLKPACPSAGERPAPLRSSARAEGMELQRAVARNCVVCSWAKGFGLQQAAPAQALGSRTPTPYPGLATRGRWRPSAAKARAVPPPLWLRRGAQCSRPHACRRTGMLRGLTCRSCLSRVNEVNVASSAAGRMREHRRLPRSEAQGTQTVGSPFLWLLSFGDAKESDSPAGAKSRLRVQPSTTTMNKRPVPSPQPSPKGRGSKPRQIP